MKILDLPLLLDENIPDLLAVQLRAEGREVMTAREAELIAADDSQVLAVARSSGRVIITQDRDFCRLAFRRGETCRGIVFLRPGHLDPTILLEMVRAAAAMEALPVPFVVVVHRRAQRLLVRVRPIVASG